MGIGRAALFLGVDEGTLRRWVRKGEGAPRCRKGKRFYYVREVLVEWLKSNAPCEAPPRPIERGNGHALPMSLAEEARTSHRSAAWRNSTR
jgi:hypothetical protein